MFRKIMKIAAGSTALIIFSSFLTYLKAFFSGFHREGNPYENLKGEEYEKINGRMHDLVREFEEIPYEQVYISANDGTKLAARYYHICDGAVLNIQCHGYHGTGLRDFCGGNKLAREAGYNTLVIDQRGHGKSGGHTITFGIKERYDCLCWVNYAIERFGKGTKIFLSGVSMGAATVLMASGLDELPENVVGVIADCPFSSPEEIIKEFCRKIKITPAIGFPLVRLGGKIFGGFDVAETDVLEAVKKKNVPMLLIHGESDDFVPCEMSREIFAAAREPKRIETFPDASHGLSYMMDTDRYAKIVEQFMNECLEGNDLPQNNLPQNDLPENYLP